MTSNPELIGGVSNAQTIDRAPHAQQSPELAAAPLGAFRTFEIGGIVVVSALVVAWIIANVANGMARTHCKTEPASLAFGPPLQRASMTVTGARPCALAIQSGDAIIESLAVDAPPGQGALALRGRTAVVYQAHRRFDGLDNFTVSLMGRKRGALGVSTIKVEVVIR